MSTIHQKLASLRNEADPSGAVPGLSRPRAWRDRVAAMLPVGLLLGFAALFVLVIGDRIVPAREVTLETVAALPSAVGSVDASASTDPNEAPLLFQASGWVEPDPRPVKATALIDGVVREVHIFEGESVKKGQLLASLIDDDATLNLRTAESRLRSLQAMADAQGSQTAIIEAEIATLKMGVLAATAKRAELEDQAKRFNALASRGTGAVSESEVVLARLQLATQEAEIAALAIGEEELLGKLEQQKAFARDFDAKIAEAKTEVERRQLELDRTRIVSPLDGVVLRLMAVPGEKRMLGMDDPNSSTIAILYEPERLQCRIDVPLAEAAKLAVGQRVRLRSSLLPDRVFHGTVTRIAGEADLQRNTLQAKVRIQDPDPRLRPEMLCRAEFLAPVATSNDRISEAETARGGVRLYVPEAALTGLDGNRAIVWRIDESGERIEPSDVNLGEERREAYRLVIEGLRPGDRVVIDPPSNLQAGERIRPKL